MTDNTTTNGNDTPDEGGHVETGTLEHLDPATLVVDTNVRDDAALDAEFIASIKEHGVLVPIVALRGEDGQVVVRAGQRRTLAAREAGLSTVPVYVRSAAAGDEKAQLVERVAEQIVENDQRRGLTNVQRAKGIQQMLDAGVSVTKVAKALSVKKDIVKAAGTAAGSQAALEALATDQLSLTEAAALAEFEDMPGALDRLVRNAGTQWFDHTVAELRQQRASDNARREAEKPWTDKGFTVLDSYPGSWDVECVELGYLLTAAGDEADEAAVTNPAHWAVLLYEEDGLVDADTGESVEAETVDWSTQDDPEAVAAEGLRHAKTVTETTVFAPDYYCLDYAAAGLTLNDEFQNYARVSGGSEESSAAVDLDDDEDAKAAREAAAAQAQKDAERRERRKVIALNKLGEAALHVRRDFVTKLLTRKTPPKGAALFVADCLARDTGLLSDHQAQDTAATLLGVDNGQAVAKLVADLPATGDARAQVITLALVLGALEARTPKDAWRGGGGVYWNRHVGSSEYLRWLADNDYQLAAVEEIVTKAKSADEVYDDHLAEAEQQ